MSASRTVIRTAGELIAAIESPDRAYSLTPMVRLNDEIDPAQLRFQLERLVEQGVRGVFLYAEKMSGLPYDYLGDDWERIAGWMLDEAAALGLDVWIYDEADWPSGMAGTKVCDADDEYAYSYLKTETVPVTGPAVIRHPAGDGFVAAALVGNDATIPQRVDPRDGVLSVDVPEGAWQLRIARKHRGVGWFTPVYTDLTHPDATETFCRETHDWYGARFGDRMGSLVRGYFTDEPTIPPSMLVWNDRYPWAPALPWSPALPQMFDAVKGYDVRPYLPLLADVAGAEAVPRSVRVDFWDVLSRCYEQNYFARIAERCARQGVEFTGHLMSEEDLKLWTYLQAGDLLRLYRHFTIPGIDWICAFGGEDASLELIPSITPTLATSSAAVHGRARVMSESFAGSGWGMTLEDARRIIDWQLVHGVNMFVAISFMYSLRGWDRSNFYPPGLGVQQPYWDHIHPLIDYIARMSAVAAIGRPRMEVGVVAPTTLLWESFADEGRLEAINESFHGLVEGLLDRQVGVCLVNEEDVLAAVARDGRLAVGAQLLDVLVVPDGCGIDPDVWRVGLENLRAGGVTILSAALDDDLSPVIDAAAAETRPDVRIEVDGAARIRTHVRSGDDATVAMLLNPSETETRCQVTFSDSAGVFELNGEHGTLHRLGEVDMVSLALAPAQLRVVIAARTADAAAVLTAAALPSAARAPRSATVLLDLTEAAWLAELEPTMDRKEVSWQFYRYASAEEQERYPHGVVPLAVGDWSEGALAGYSGGVRYQTRFRYEPSGSAERVVLDLGRVSVTAHVTLNGRDLGTRCWAPYSFEVTEYLAHGDNELVVSVRNTLANYYARFDEFGTVSLIQGGTVRERLASGLIGPVRLTVGEPVA